MKHQIQVAVTWDGCATTILSLSIRREKDIAMFLRSIKKVCFAVGFDVQLKTNCFSSILNPASTGDINLGIWVNKQRMERRKRNKGKKSSMSPSRERRLNDIKFNWGKEKGQASWDEKYVSCGIKARVVSLEQLYYSPSTFVLSCRENYVLSKNCMVIAG